MADSQAVVSILLYFILPLWLAAGFADYLCHRASRIETTAGYKESLIHLLMFAEVALPLPGDHPVYTKGSAGIAELDLPDTSPVLRRGLFGVNQTPA